MTAPTLPYPNHNSLLVDEVEAIKNQQIPKHNIWLDKLTYQINQDLEQDAASPLFFKNRVVSPSKASWKLLKEWCQGYLHGVSLDHVWVEDEHGFALTMPMGILADELDLVGLLDSSNCRIVDNLPHKKLARENLPNAIASLYSYWKKQCSLKK